MADGQFVVPTSVLLPSGQILDLTRPRSQGVLDAEALAYCRDRGIALAFDPVQIGSVIANCEDDLSAWQQPSDWPQRSDAAGRSPQLPDRIQRLRQRLRLRPWQLRDADAFVDLLDNPAVWRFLPDNYPAPLTRDVALGLIELSNSATHHVVLAIEAGGQVVGQVRLLFEEERDRAAQGEISYWLGEPHWGQGLASDAVALFTFDCFQQRPALESIIARVQNDNRASAKVLEKCGYCLAPRAAAAAVLDYRIDRRAAERAIARS